MSSRAEASITTFPKLSTVSEDLNMSELNAPLGMMNLFISPSVKLLNSLICGHVTSTYGHVESDEATW